MYTKEVENLKISQILKIVENIIESNLSLYLAGIITLTIMSSLFDFVAGDNIYLIIILLFANAIVTWAVKVVTLRGLKADKLENSLILARVKKGNIVKQGLIYAAFYIVTGIVLGIIMTIIMLIVSAIVLVVPALGNLVSFLVLLVALPLSIMFDTLISGITIEVFCKDEKSKFIINAYNNIFKSKNTTFRKLLLGFLMLMVAMMVVSAPIAIPQANTFTLLLISLLSSFITVIGWTYVYVVYMTSITDKDLVEVNESQNTQNNISNTNNQNSVNSDEVTRLW